MQRMGTTTIRITGETHARLRELAAQEGATLQAVLDRAVEAYRRQCFLDGLADDFARLRANPEAWAEEQAEREVWDSALADGLGDE